MTEEQRPEQDADEDAPLAGNSPTEEEQEELESGGNAGEVVESKDEDGPTKTPGA